MRISAESKAYPEQRRRGLRLGRRVPQVTLYLFCRGGRDHPCRIRFTGARHNERLNPVPHGAIVLNFNVRPHESAREPTISSTGNRALLVFGLITPQYLRALRIYSLNRTPAMKQSLRLVEINRLPHVRRDTSVVLT